MTKKNNSNHKKTEPTWLFLFGLGSAVYLFGFQYDFSEYLWALTRSLELWELDELVLAILAVLIAAVVILRQRVSALQAQVDDLIENRGKTSNTVALETDDASCLVQCVGCGKYQIHGDLWFTIDDLTKHAEQPGQLGGVCEDCRITANR